MTNQQKKGFTIIEVVLVLAIAGLIFLMVFIALPALQRGQRDGQRRDDVSRFVSQLSSYQANNRGALPGTAAELTRFNTEYLKWQSGDAGEFKDPRTGNGYTITLGIGVPNDGQIRYARNAQCNGEVMQSAGGNNRQAAVAVKLEGAGVFCQSVQ